MELISIFVLLALGYCVTSLALYERRKNSIIIVDLDSVLVDISHIAKRGEIYIKNHPDRDIGEYLGSHISEQEIKPCGLRQVLKLQDEYYKLVFMSIRDESLRAETADILNQWGLVGELYMNTGYSYGWQLKCDLITTLLNKKERIVGVVDWSGDVSTIVGVFPNIKILNLK